MANYRAIHSVGHSLATWLKNSFPVELAAGQTFDIRLISSGEMNDADEPGPGLTLYLYRVTVNEHLRNAKNPNDPAGSRAPLSLDLHYLMTVWAGTPDVEHVVLGWALDRLHQNPVLDLSALTPEAEWTAGDVVQLIPAELSTEDIMRIWDALKPQYRLSVSYIARVVRVGGTRNTATAAVGSSFGWRSNAEAPS
ncbi:MAG TPA: DUF4255 domain-containing protein [Longimicrobium sp.]|nr:DUF4255 domain-containing protein [Longimicrobium sp.]